MNGSIYPRLFLLLFVLCCHNGFGQYILNGSAQKVSCNCYTLTDEKTTQSGSVWNSNKINLQNSFDFWFNVFLGCKNNDGADGIVFILQPVSTSIGSTGEGMGFNGVQPSIGIALDTWQNLNLNDPDYDHISLQANGVINHNNDLAGPLPASSTSNNIEDCKWHVLRISWDAGSKTIKAFFDGVLRFEKQIDLIPAIFQNDPNVYWGFTGATGGFFNQQQFCTALNPIFNTNVSGSNGCVGSAVNFSDASESFAPITSYNWSFGDGTFSTEKTPEPHLYPAAGKYPVNLKIKGQDGCEKDSTIIVTVGSIPNAELIAFDTCFGFTPRIQLKENNFGVSYHWLLDGTSISNTQQPQIKPPDEGEHTLQLLVSSDFDCGPEAKVEADFTIKPSPKIEVLVEDGCVNETVFFNGKQTDNKTNISQWQWNFGDGTGTASQNATHQYSLPNQYIIKLWANATNGCTSDTSSTILNINKAIVFAGNDTAVIKGMPFQLSGRGNGTFLWSPSAIVSDPSSQNPTVTLQNDQRFELNVTTSEGCQATDAVLIRTFNGPAVYVPTAFTPNGDGKNEVLRPVYVGIKELKQFAVFNRWGQMVFRTKEMNRGWEGRGVAAGTYVWLVQAVTANNQPILLKGTVTIIQ